MSSQESENVSSEDEDLERPLLGRLAAGVVTAVRSSEGLSPSVSASPSQLNTALPQQRARSSFNADWVRSLHEEIQVEVQREGNGKDTGIYACMWERILEKWQKHIRDVPYEQVQVACVKQILQHARLTSASASPMFYETLRRLGKDVLVMQEQVDENLLEKLLPSSKDTKWYEGFFGERERWTTEYLAHHLKTLHGSSNMKIDKRHEQQLGFIVAHVRSNRYNSVEMQAILKVCKLVRVTCQTRTLTTSTFACMHLYED